MRAFTQAQREIDRAINNTLRELFEPGRGGGSGNPFRLSRFPDAVARRAARPAELFERTLLHIRKMVDIGAYANVTDDFRYEEILTREQVSVQILLTQCWCNKYL